MMNTQNLFDDIARSLARPISRREAASTILKGLAGAALATVFGGSTARAAGCPKGQPACGTTCCPRGWICCDASTGLCCNRGQTCDGKKCKNNISPSTGGGGGGDGR